MQTPPWNCMNDDTTNIAAAGPTVFPVADFNELKYKVLNWASRFSTFCFLDNHQYRSSWQAEECLLGAGLQRSLSAQSGNALSHLAAFTAGNTGWLFGHLGYDLKNELFSLHSSHPDQIGFPDLFFFEPEIVVRLNKQQMEIFAANAGEVYQAILNTPGTREPYPTSVPEIQSRFSRNEYLEVMYQLQQHIQRGDCYEINFCQEFFAENVGADPVDLFYRLCRVSPNPFAALYRMQDRWLICASPERYFRKTGNKIFSQPIKGTAPRIPGNPQLDAAAIKELYESGKDRSENVMVVDLVRNDLSKICEDGTVLADELFKVYSYPQVHQMISTISGTLLPGTDLASIVRASFPMGSMTGAPKKRVLELIEKYERTRRGLFSGSVGYISPDGTMDFNVVIRSILYNASDRYLSFPAGSGITFYAEAEAEWEECLLKAAAIRKILEEKNT